MTRTMLPRTAALLPPAPPRTLLRPRLEAALLAAAVIAVAILAACVALGAADEELESMAASFVAPVLDLVAAVLIAGAAASAPTARIRLGWRLLAVALVSYAVGDAIWALITYVLGGEAFPSIADGAYLAYYGLVATALLLFPSPATARRETARLAIDSAIVTLSGGIVIWASLIHPLLEASQTTWIGELLAFGYPIGDLVLLFAVGTIAMRRPVGIQPRALVALVAGLALMLAADLGYGQMELLNVDGQIWVDVAYLASSVATAAAGFFQMRTPTSTPAEDGGRTEGLLLRFPYLTLAAAFLTLLLALSQGDLELVTQIVEGAIGLAFLVLIRQEVISRDNARLVAEAARRETEQRYQALERHASDAFLLVDPDGQVAFASPSIDRVCGVDPVRVVGAPVTRLAHADDVERLERLIGDTAAGRPVAPLEWRIWTRDGAWRPVETVPANLLDDPAIGKIVLTTRDVGEREALRQQVAQAALRDVLTGLPNRVLLEDRVAQAILAGRRNRHSTATLLLDIDGFSRINAAFGHAAGDRVLREVGRRLAATIRAADTVARLDADSFGVLIVGSGDAPRTLEIAARIGGVLREPIAWAGTSVDLSASIGIATAEDGGEADAASLLRDAEVALAEARRRGTGEVVVFEPTMLRDLTGRLELEADLRHALPGGELFLEYQPIYELETGELASAEALIRWQHPARGRMEPGDFIPLAEEAGIINDLGRWALREACREAARWARLAPGRIPRVAVNLAAPQIADPQLAWIVQSALAEGGAAPGWLTLEVTESLLVGNGPDILERLHAVRALGVTLGIDDFGTGYSSLAYLQQFPVSHLKIDRSFVAPLDRETGDPGLAPAIIQIAGALGLSTIAEGIETERQLRRLRELGSSMGQGFFLGRPLDAETMRGRVRDGERLIAAA